MSTLGFPWNAEVHDEDRSLLSEKGVWSLEPDTGRSFQEITNRDRVASSLSTEKPPLDDIGQTRLSPSMSGQAGRIIRNESFDGMGFERTENSSDRPMVRTIPPWIQSVTEDDLKSPSAALIAQHNNSPSATRKPFLHPGNQDRIEGYTKSSTRPERTSRWVTFAKASAYPRESFDGEKVDPEWLNEHFGDYSRPWLSNRDGDDAENGSGLETTRRNTRVWYKRAQLTVLRNPFIPLMFRLIVFTFACAALGLSASIFQMTTGKIGIDQTASSQMAIVVDAVALVYIPFVTWDEYMGKPLGLRRARSKVRIVLLDLFFIVFMAANLSLAMQGLSSIAEACEGGDRDSKICHRQRALASVLLIALIAWLMTFSVSVLRLVEKMVQH